MHIDIDDSPLTPQFKTFKGFSTNVTYIQNLGHSHLIIIIHVIKTLASPSFLVPMSEII